MNQTNAKKIMPSRFQSLLAVAIFLLIQLGSFSLAGPIILFTDSLSAIIVGGYLLSVTLIKWPPRYGVSLLALYSFKPLQGQQLLFAQSYFKLLQKHILSVGIFGLVVGGVVIFDNMDDPNAIGPGIAVSLLTLLYGYMAKFLFTFYSYYYQPLATDKEDSTRKGLTAVDNDNKLAS